MLEAVVLNCKIATLPLVYLGLPVGGDCRRLNFWEPVVNHIKSRLSSWKSKYLSFGDQPVQAGVARGQLGGGR